MGPWLLGATIIGGALSIGFSILQIGTSAWDLHSRHRIALRVPGPDQEPLGLVARQVAAAWLDQTETGIVLRVPSLTERRWLPKPSSRVRAEWHGAAALRIAARMLPMVNVAGGGRRTIQAATGLIDAAADQSQAFSELASWAARGRWRGQRELGQLPAPLRLALEMAAHEESEQTWLAGDLAELERAWRDAEELAKIADGLAVPAAVEAAFTKLKQRSDKETDR